MRGGIKGNRGGQKGRSGRKSKADEMGLAALLNRCFTTEDRENCIVKLAEDCQSTEFQVRHESRKLLLAYAFGRPTEKHEVGGGDLPIEIIVKHVKRGTEKD